MRDRCPKYDFLSGEGLKVSDKRVKAIAEVPASQNQSELRSFLGSVQFCVKFIPNFATMSSSLWDLTCKAAEWCWGPRGDEPLEMSKPD